MMKKTIAKVWTALFAAGLFLVSASPAAADLSWEEETVVTVEFDGKVKELSREHHSYSLKANLLRIDDPAQGGARLINLTNQSVLFVAYQARTYVLTTVADLAAEDRERREEVKRELATRESQIAKLPSESRAEMAAALEGQKLKYQLWERPYQVRPTGQTEKCLRYTCEKYQGLSGDKVFQEILVAKDLGMDPESWRLFARTMAELDPQQFSHLLHVPGLPLRVVYDYGPVKVVSEAKSVSRAKIPAEAFILPEGFQVSPYLNPAGR